MKDTKKIRILGRCLVCNTKAKNHHYYCDEHYPKEKVLKGQLKYYKKLIENLKRENTNLKMAKKHLRKELDECRKR